MGPVPEADRGSLTSKQVPEAELGDGVDFRGRGAEVGQSE